MLPHTKISFVDTDPDAVVTALVSHYETATGKRLHPAQVERLVFQSAAYRISLMLNAINETANQCFVAFSTADGLELIAQLMGVTRLTASSASCTIRFTLVDGHGALTLPAGLRVQSVDGQVVFQTIESKAVVDADTYVDVECECNKSGIIGNGYAIGNINVILDPQPYISAASNLDATGGGADDETDEALRQRILLAPSQFSVAGPADAYKFWAMSAHPSIVDVAVTIGHDPTTDYVIPGQVDIHPLLAEQAALTTEISDAIYAICNDEKVRPLTDTVVVKEPTKVDYEIEVNLTILTEGDPATVIADVTAKLQAFVNARKNKLGLDAVRTQIIAAAQANNVYNIDLVSPAIDQVVNERSYTNCTGITVTIVGTHDA